MKLAVIKNAVTSNVGRQILLGKKHSPTIMFAGGVVSAVGTVVLACRATLKVEGVLDDADKKRMQIKTMVHPEYSEKDRTKDNLYLSIQTVAEVTKLYAPAIGLGVVSIGLLTGSHITLSRRNVAVTAAYKAVEESFETYRGRVRENLGEEKERELYRGVDEEDIHDTAKGTVDKRKFINPGGGPPSMYAELFDKNNVNWSDRPEVNLMFLRASQNYANNQLHAKGYVLLNDVLDSLGIERTKEGCVVGWVLPKKGEKPHKDQDCYVDFGIFDASDDPYKLYDFIAGNEPIWLDFNVDGVVYDKI